MQQPRIPKLPDAGLGWGCNYPLRDVASGACPECGRGFEAADSSSVNMSGRPLGRLRRLALRPPVWPLMLAVVLVGAWHAWLLRWGAEGAYRDELYFGEYLALGWSAVALTWGAMLGARAWVLWRVRHIPAAIRGRVLPRFWVAPTLAAAVLLLLATPLPRTAYSRFNRLWLDDLVRDVRSRPLRIDYPDRRGGLLRMSQIYATPEEVGVMIGKDSTHAWFLTHRPAGPPSHVFGHPVESLGGGWYREEAGKYWPMVMLDQQVKWLEQLRDDPAAARAHPDALAEALALDIVDHALAFAYGEHPCGLRPVFDEGLDGADDEPRAELPTVGWELIRPDMHALLRLGPGAVPVLRRAMSHRDSRVRTRAGLVAARLGPTAAPLVDDLIRVLSDADGGVREAAAAALAHMGEAAEPARATLLTLLSDPDAGVQYNAAVALRRLGLREAEVPVVLAVFQPPPTAAPVFATRRALFPQRSNFALSVFADQEQFALPVQTLAVLAGALRDARPDDPGVLKVPLLRFRQIHADPAGYLGERADAAPNVDLEWTEESLNRIQESARGGLVRFSRRDPVLIESLVDDLLVLLPAYLPDVAHPRDMTRRQRADHTLAASLLAWLERVEPDHPRVVAFLAAGLDDADADADAWRATVYRDLLIRIAPDHASLGGLRRDPGWSRTRPEPTDVREDGPPPTREQVLVWAQSIGFSGPWQAADAIIAGRVDVTGDARVAAALAEALEGQGLSPDSEPLLRAMMIVDPPRATAVLTAIIRREMAWYEEPLAKDQTTDGPSSDIDLAVARLGDLGPAAAPAIPTLIALLDEASATTRLAAIATLVKLGPDAVRAAAPRLELHRLGDMDPRVRHAAAEALDSLRPSI